MSAFPAEVDVAIIGAGAAGLGAAHALKNSKLSTLILEARDRIGGRAHTLQLQDNITFDEGCGWLHAATRNSFAPIAKRLNFKIDKKLPPWRKQASNKNLTNLTPKEHKEYFKAFDSFYERVAKGAKLAEDKPASAWLEPGNRWNTAIDALSTYINGCELDLVSTHDLDAYDGEGGNWRIKRGYGALMAAYAASCPIICETKVRLVDCTKSFVRLETPRGTLQARAVIITVPTNLIAEEAIRFLPALPEKIEAAAGLPLGIANKVMLLIDKAEDLPTDGLLRRVVDRIKVGTYHLRPQGQPCIEGYFGGHFARELEQAGKNALFAQAIDEIVAVLGSHFRRKLKPLAASSWALDPFALGSYSYALPGHAKDRAVLAAPVDNRLFFAGEATSPHFFSTAHGARDSGERAANEVLQLAEL